jgi:hypothetical protein
LIVALILSLNLAPAGLFDRVRRLPRTWNMLMLPVLVSPNCSSPASTGWYARAATEQRPQRFAIQHSGPAARLGRSSRADP